MKKKTYKKRFPHIVVSPEIQKRLDSLRVSPSESYPYLVERLLRKAGK